MGDETHLKESSSHLVVLKKVVFMVEVVAAVVALVEVVVLVEVVAVVDVFVDVEMTAGVELVVVEAIVVPAVNETTAEDEATDVGVDEVVLGVTVIAAIVEGGVSAIIGQDASSDPSEQSSTPLQRNASEIHSPDLHI